MAKTSIFSGLATESTLKRLLANLHFARDNSDQLRVVVANTASMNTLGVALWNNGTYTLWNAFGGPNSMDAREQMKAQARANVQQVRATRWTYT